MELLPGKTYSQLTAPWSLQHNNGTQTSSLPTQQRHPNIQSPYTTTAPKHPVPLHNNGTQTSSPPTQQWHPNIQSPYRDELLVNVTVLTFQPLTRQGVDYQSPDSHTGQISSAHFKNAEAYTFALLNTGRKFTGNRMQGCFNKTTCIQHSNSSSLIHQRDRPCLWQFPLEHWQESLMQDHLYDSVTFIFFTQEIKRNDKIEGKVVS